MNIQHKKVLNLFSFSLPSSAPPYIICQYYFNFKKHKKIKSDAIIDMMGHQARIWYEMAMDYLKDLSHHLTVGSEQNHKIYQVRIVSKKVRFKLYTSQTETHSITTAAT
jgi:hypothetical protein